MGRIPIRIKVCGEEYRWASYWPLDGEFHIFRNKNDLDGIGLTWDKITLWHGKEILIDRIDRASDPGEAIEKLEHEADLLLDPAERQRIRDVLKGLAEAWKEVRRRTWYGAVQLDCLSKLLEDLKARGVVRVNGTAIDEAIEAARKVEKLLLLGNTTTWEIVDEDEIEVTLEGFANLELEVREPDHEAQCIG